MCMKNLGHRLFLFSFLVFFGLLFSEEAEIRARTIAGGNPEADQSKAQIPSSPIAVSVKEARVDTSGKQSSKTGKTAGENKGVSLVQKKQGPQVKVDDWDSDGQGGKNDAAEELLDNKKERIKSEIEENQKRLEAAQKEIKEALSSENKLDKQNKKKLKRNKRNLKRDNDILRSNLRDAKNGHFPDKTASPMSAAEWARLKKGLLDKENGHFKDLWRDVLNSSCVSNGVIAGKKLSGNGVEGVFANAVSMIKSICRGKIKNQGRLSLNSRISNALSGPPGNRRKDALTQGHLLRGIRPLVNTVNNAIGNTPLTYAITTSLMARESDFRAGTGIDSNNATSMRNPNGAEAGPGQVSYGSMGKTGVRRALYEKYLNAYDEKGEDRFISENCSNPPYMSKKYKIEPSSGKPDSRQRTFQILMKKCWALASEYLSLNIRLQRREHGPLRDASTGKTSLQRNHWGKAKVKPACVKMFYSAAEKYTSDQNCQQFKDIDYPASPNVFVPSVEVQGQTSHE